MPNKRRIRRVVTVLLAAVFAGAPATAPAVAAPAGIPTPEQDSFYAPPAELPAAPGVVIRSRTVTDLDFLTPLAAHAWQVLYRSTSALGQPVAVSGTVLVPTTPWTAGPRPLVTFAFGGHGFASHCAPSYKMRTGTEDQLDFIKLALAQGWAVVATDYERLGTPGPHTLGVGPSEAHAVLDAARAAQRLSDAGLRQDAPVGIAGYSQGGQASAWAAELQPSYAPELDVRGTSSGGVMADVGEMAKTLDGGLASSMELAVLVGHGSAYPDLDLDGVLNDAGRSMAARLSSSCLLELELEYSFRRLDDFTTVGDLLNTPLWRARLDQDVLGRNTPRAPIMIYIGTLDEVVPVPRAEQLYHDYCARGIPVTWRPMPLLNHGSADRIGARGAVDWLAGRFADAPVDNSCGT
ncbi:lipase family protein [Nocardia sp. NEAU-G5]|uniref:Lipase family protein n=1 Tax=Nocardia albiluteola TaxID=2842303 RepID=A0ABS6B4W9_9NOCA|nr:lipase family protein [Nocardia albiluteola]MBU3065360.1 lipase family protein [Nocardia albiluteola]